MIKYGDQILDYDDYRVLHKYDGTDELYFTLPVHHVQMQDFYEEQELILTENNQNYILKSIDEGAQTVSFIAYLNLDEWKESMTLDYVSGYITPASMVTNARPPGWTVIDNSSISETRIVQLEAATPFSIYQHAIALFNLGGQFDNATRTLTIVNPNMVPPIGAFITSELNLTEIAFKGKSTELVTRMYVRGKDGLSIASVNAGLDYIDNFTYTSKIVCGFFKDERFADPNTLKSTAERNLASVCIPSRSYECSVVDLAKRDSDYSFQNFNLFNTVTLLDPIRNTRLDHRVVEYMEYYNAPRKNIVTLSTVPQKITSQVTSIREAVTNPTSDFQQQMQAIIDTATEKITGELGGNFIFTYNLNNQPNGFMIMDTPDITTAQQVMRVNLQGIGFSSTGVNGPYTSAWLLDGTFIADFITSGHLSADRIAGGTLVSTNGITEFNLNNGVLSIEGSSGGNFLYMGPQGFFLTPVRGDYNNFFGGVLFGRNAEVGAGVQMEAFQYVMRSNDNGAITRLLWGWLAKDSNNNAYSRLQPDSVSIPASTGSYTNFLFEGYGITRKYVDINGTRHYYLAWG